MRTGLESLSATSIEQTIPQRFRRVVEACGDQPAIRSALHSWTYEDLDRASAAVAARIQDLRCDRGAPIAIAMPLDAPVIAAMFGVIRAGRTYVCLPPDHPSDALRPILDHLKPAVVLGHEEELKPVHAAALPGLAIHELEQTFERSSPAAENIGIRPQDPFCILYTSGSSGRPKGVVRSHRSLMNQLRAYSDAVRIRPGDHMTMLSSPSHGASTSSVYGALLTGGCLYPLDVRSAGLAGLATWLSHNMITIYHSVPTLFRGLLRALEGKDNLPALRVVKLGGEVVYPADVDLFRERIHAGCTLVNGLGMTEAAGNLCYYHIKRRTRIEGYTVPVGTARKGTELVVLGADERPVRTGEIGELVVRDNCLASGYWNDPDLTRERFTALTDGRVEFRTGDRVRMSSKGVIEHMGRVDRQVKVRGDMVDPAIVESCLLEHDQVAAAAVEPFHLDGSGDLGLCAYVSPVQGAGPDAAELMRFLARSLAAFMVPQRFIVLAEFPRTDSGKLDRKALPSVRAAARKLSPDDRPRGGLELSIARIVENDLCLRPVGREDNLFELGVSSMMVLQLLARLEQRHSLTATPGDVLGNPSVAALATHIGHGAGAAADTAVVALKAGAEGIPLFLAHPIKGDVMIYLPLMAHLPEGQAVYGLEARGMHAGETCPDTYEEMARAYIADIKRIQPTGPYVLGGFSAGGTIAFEMARQLAHDGDNVATVIIIDTSAVAGRGIAEARTQHWRARLLTHLRCLSDLPMGSWVEYMTGRWRTVRRLLVRRFSSLSPPLGRATGPAADVLSGVTDALRVASRRYAITPQPLHVSLLRSAWEKTPRADRLGSDLGWGTFAQRGVDTEILSGDHVSLMKEPRVRELARAVQACLERAVCAAEMSANQL
ncbi:MAG: AMP-binding protein [Verrucomicrobia bacterium]|nr:AMP-binding protein [Verrucomicrobiota bacterium]MDA1087492.1 AMP-binding protein [Verrucomicrobiota bacterium]